MSGSGLAQYAAARSLEDRLGDPQRAERPLSFESVVAADEREVLPEGARDALADWGLHRHYVPVAAEGRLASFEESLALLRVVSRRDLTTAIAHARTFLGAAPVWIGGGPAQVRRLADHVLAGGAVALALTERDHGSDLLATDVRAVPDGGGWRLSGEKWLINGATSSGLVLVFARTDDAGGPRGFSLFLLDRERCRAFEPLSRVRTLGLRGAELSGFRLRDEHVPAEALVGGAGAGLEIVLRALLVTRTLVPGLALGAADTALAATLDFARTRILYGRPLSAMPTAVDTLAGAFADLLLCDAVATVAARRLHTAPEQAAVGAAVVKSLVPTTVERMVGELGVVLGARHFLREGHWSGVFQKVLRDVGVTSLFDGSTAVCLQSLAVQLRALARARESHAGDAAAFDLGASLPPVEWRRLELASRDDGVLHGLAAAAGRLPEAEASAAVAALVRELSARVTILRDQVESAWSRLGAEFARSVEGIDLARRYCALHAAAAAVQLWIGSWRQLDGFFAEGWWLALGLARLLRLDPVPDAARVAGARVMAELLRRAESRTSFGLVAFAR